MESGGRVPLAEPGPALRITSRAPRMPVHRDSQQQDTQASGARHTDHGDTVQDCSTWTADERLARTKEGNET